MPGDMAQGIVTSLPASNSWQQPRKDAMLVAAPPVQIRERRGKGKKAAKQNETDGQRKGFGRELVEARSLIHGISLKFLAEVLGPIHPLTLVHALAIRLGL